MDESLGSAIQENEKYMESLEARTNQLKATFQDLANNVIDNQLVKSLISLANEGLELLNTDLGTILTQITLLSGLGWGVTSLLKAGKFVQTAIGQFKAFNDVLKTGGTLMAATSAASLPLIAAISALVILSPKLIGFIKEQNLNFEDATAKLKDNSAQLQANKERLEEISKLEWYDITPEILKEKDALEKVNKELEEEIAKLKERQAVLAREGGTISAGSKFYTTVTGASSYTTEEEAVAGAYRAMYGREAKDIEAARKELELYGIVIEEHEEQIKVNSEAYNQYLIKSYNEYLDKINQGIELSDEEHAKFAELGAELQDQATKIQALSDTNVALTTTEKELLTVNERRINQLKVAKGAYIALSSDAIGVLLKQYPALKSAIEKINDVNYLNIDSLDAVQTATLEEKKAMYDLIAAQTIFNNTELDASQKIQELGKLAAAAGVASELIADTTSGGDTYNVALRKLTNQGLSMEEAKSQYAQSIWKRWMNSMDEVEPKSTGGGKSRIEKANDAWKEQLELLKDRLELLEKSGATEEEQVAQMRLIQDAIHAQAEKYREMGLSEEHEYLRELGILWWDYEKQIEEVYDNATEAAKKAAEEAQEAWKKALKIQQTQLEETINKYEVAFDYMVSQIEKEIKLLEEEKKVTEEYWDNRIAALETANDEMERQLALEEAQEALAKARSTKVLVYKDGRYQYISDIEQVSQASANLDKIKREETLRKEVENLERLKEKALEAIDNQIEGWEKYKEEWGSVVSDYKEEQDKLLAYEVLGIEAENENWQTRLDNLDSFIEEYKNYLKELKKIQEELEQIQNPTLKPSVDFDPVTGEGIMSEADQAALKAAGDAYNEAKARGDEASMAAAHAAAEAIRAKYGYTGGTTGGEFGWISGADASIKGEKPKENIVSGGAWTDSNGKVQYPEGHPGAEIDKDHNGRPDSNWLKENGAPSWVVELEKGHEQGKYAYGTTHASGGISLVGENGPELRVLNNGDGIIPADITKNLWAWGSITPASMMSALSGGFGFGGQQIVIQNLNLPGVRDGNDFVQYMRNNFWISTVQFVAT